MTSGIDGNIQAWQIEKAMVEITKQIDFFLEKQQFVILAIDGNSGAGKSTLASRLSQKEHAELIHMDHFFLREEQRTAERLAEAGGNIDYERFQTEVVDSLRSGKEFFHRRYDCASGDFGKEVFIGANRIYIVEGVYCEHPRFGDYADIKVVLTVDGKIQNERILKRSGALLHERFQREWIPMEDRYFAECKILEKADIVIRLEFD